MTQSGELFGILKENTHINLYGHGLNSFIYCESQTVETVLYAITIVLLTCLACLGILVCKEISSIKMMAWLEQYTGSSSIFVSWAHYRSCLFNSWRLYTQTELVLTSPSKTCFCFIKQHVPCNRLSYIGTWSKFSTSIASILINFPSIILCHTLGTGAEIE